MTDATKRKEPEAEAPKIAVAVATKPASDEPESKKLKTTPPDAATVRKQMEYYMSDENLKHDKFFHDKISGNSEGWLELSFVLNCNKMKAMRSTKEDVVAALKDSKIEVKEDGLSIRRPGNLALPAFEARNQHANKKTSSHAHDGGVIAMFKDIPAEQSWMQLKDLLRTKLPEKVPIWFVSEVSDKKTCIVAVAPFEGDMQFFEELQMELGGAKISTEVAQGDALQTSLKVLPQHIRDKRQKNALKAQKERNRPIIVGSMKFVNVNALRTRVKEILNSRSDGEKLNPEGSDFKLIKAVLGFHPKGESKSAGMVGIKVGTSSQGGNRCFWMVKEDGKEEDFSAVKCVSAIENNPPYVEDKKAKEPAEAKKEEAPAATADKKEEAPAPASAAADKKEEEAPAAPAAEEKKEPAAADKKEEEAPAAPAAEEKKE